MIRLNCSIPITRQVPWTETGIALQTDVDHLFKNPPDNIAGIRVIKNFTDEDFIVWMRAATFPDFRKLYRIIHADLFPGIYHVEVVNLWPTWDFKGEKRVIIGTTTWVGSSNYLLGGTYIAVGAVSLLLSLSFFLKHKIAPRKLGDPSYLHWDR